MRRWGHLAQRGGQLNTANATSANTRPRSASGAASRRGAQAGGWCGGDDPAATFLPTHRGVSRDLPTVTRRHKETSRKGRPRRRERRGTWAWFTVVPDRLAEIAAVFR